MAKHCLRCGYHTPDAWADECPFCLVTLARAREGGPVAVAARPFRRLPAKLLVPLGLLVAAVLLAVATGAIALITDEIALGPVRTADTTGRVRAGMTAADVSRALGMDDPGEDHFTGRFVWQRQGRLLRVTFRHGRVTGVEEGRPLPPLGGVDRTETHYHN
jgi:hypothetical protein